MNTQTKMTVKTPLGEGVMHGNVCVVTQHGHENWCLSGWRDAGYQNMMVEFTGKFLDYRMDQEEPCPVYSALILSNGLSVEDVTQLILSRLKEQPKAAVCYVQWMDETQRYDNAQIINQFFRHDYAERIFDARTGEQLELEEVIRLKENDAFEEHHVKIEHEHVAHELALMYNEYHHWEIDREWETRFRLGGYENRSWYMSSSIPADQFFPQWACCLDDDGGNE